MVSTGRSAANDVDLFRKLFYAAGDPGIPPVFVLDALQNNNVLEKLAMRRALEKATQPNREIFGPPEKSLSSLKVEGQYLTTHQRHQHFANEAQTAEARSDDGWTVGQNQLATLQLRAAHEATRTALAAQLVNALTAVTACTDWVHVRYFGPPYARPFLRVL